MSGDERGDSQNNLGKVLSRLGERESVTARLQEAVVAYRSALEEWTRERVPLDWARTQNNLGTALSSLGERESGTERLQEAVQAYRSALEVRTRERVPLQWAGTQNNLKATLDCLKSAWENNRVQRSGTMKRRKRPVIPTPTSLDPQLSRDAVILTLP